MKIGKEKALEIIENSGGKFITVVFNAKAGERKMNGQYFNTSRLGLVRLKESSKLKAKENAMRNFYIKDLISFKANKVEYKIN